MSHGLEHEMIDFGGRCLYVFLCGFVKFGFGNENARELRGGVRGRGREAIRLPPSGARPPARTRAPARTRPHA